MSLIDAGSGPNGFRSLQPLEYNPIERGGLRRSLA
jgi:hypothetical protein